jgi:PKD repeat protein
VLEGGGTGVVTAPATLDFNGSGSYSKNPAAKIVSWAWDFDDGTGASGEQVSHTFEAGTFTVTLTVTDSDGAQASSTASVTVEASLPPNTPVPSPPVADPQIGAESPSASGGLTANLDGSGSHATDPSAELVGWSWDFGDGSQAKGEKVSHTFAPGTYTITLTVTDSLGARGVGTLPLEVPAPLQTGSGVTAKVRVGFSDTVGYAPFSVYLDCSRSRPLDTAATITRCDWDFGDGTQASGGPPLMHTFVQPGTYTITLTAFASDGSHGSAGVSVDVLPAASAKTVWARGFPGSRPWLASNAAGATALSYVGQDGLFHLQRLDPSSGSQLWDVTDGPLPPWSDVLPAYARGIEVNADAVEVFHWPNGPGVFDGFQLCARALADGSAGACSRQGEFDGAWWVTSSYGARTEWVDTWVNPDGSFAKANLADGSAWSVQLSPAAARPALTPGGAGLAPNGDLIVLVNAAAGATFDSTPLPTGALILRINPSGQLLWFKTTATSAESLGVGPTGEIVEAASFPAPAAFGDQRLEAGVYVMFRGPDGTPERAQRVGPSGMAWVAFSTSGDAVALYNGVRQLRVFRFSATGELRWVKPFAGPLPILEASGLSVVGDDVLVAGQLSQPFDFGTGTLPAGGFILDLRG